MHCIVDTTVRNADTYYKTYRFEPSPAGDITISPGGAGITSTAKIDLKLILSKMKALGSGGELMVVTHSSTDGLMMPLVTGGNVAAQFSVMLKILEIMDGIKTRDAINTLPAAGVPKAWQDWFAKFEPGVKLETGFETNPDWKRYVVQKYGEWHARQGRVTLGLPQPQKDFPELIALVTHVRNAGFKRLEFRACDFGSSMATVAGFLSTKTLVAPKPGVWTGFFPLQRVRILSPADFDERVKRRGARRFDPILFALHILGNQSDTWATSKNEVKAFVKKYVNATYSGEVQPLSMSALELLADQRYVFPLEAGYKKLLVMFGGGKTAGATP
jgi:hypothetical protein